MMSSSSDTAIPKLVDFGLTKILGNNEQTREAYGTIGYCAPEVLSKQPYSFSCDLWGIGCIIHALMTSTLPFDHDDEKELQRMTIEEPVQFSKKAWVKVSREAFDLTNSLL